MTALNYGIFISSFQCFPSNLYHSLSTHFLRLLHTKEKSYLVCYFTALLLEDKNIFSCKLSDSYLVKVKLLHSKCRGKWHRLLSLLGDVFVQLAYYSKFRIGYFWEEYVYCCLFFL